MAKIIEIQNAINKLKNLTVKSGETARYVVPFALNDPHGEWRVAVAEVLSGKTVERKMTR